MIKRLRASATSVRLGIAAVVIALPLGAALAQRAPNSVIENCNQQAVKQPGFQCNTCDQQRDDVEHACEANGGRVPGSEFNNYGRRY
jgi:hypothetical protein